MGASDRSPRGAASATVLAIGMVTAAGDSAEQTIHSVEAGVCRYRESPVSNRRGHPMKLALLPEDSLPPLDPALASAALPARERRMLRLAKPALLEAVRGLTDTAAPPLFLAGPESLPDRPPAMAPEFLDRLLVQCPGAFDRTRSAIFPTGRAGGFQALRAAMEFLSANGGCALVGGVDTFFDLYLLGTLDLEDRVLAEGVMDGFAPGEGAAFLLIAIRPGEGVRVLPPGMAEEQGHRFSALPYSGDGLTEAFRSALAGGEGEPVRAVYASLNGESFGAREWGVAYTRHQAFFDPELRVEHPAECFGDPGAAAAPLLVGLAASGMTSGRVAGPCLAWCSSDGPWRAAATITLGGI